MSMCKLMIMVKLWWKKSCKESEQFVQRRKMHRSTPNFIPLPSSLRSASYRQVRLTGGYDLGGASGHLQHLPRTLTTTTFIIPLTKLS